MSKLSFRNCNKNALEAEKKIASYSLFYDEEELAIFFKDFLETMKQSDLKLSQNMSMFLTSYKKVVDDYPELLNTMSTDKFYAEPLVNKIIENVEFDSFSEKIKNEFGEWITEVENMFNNTQVDNRFMLGEDCCFFYYWNSFLDKVQTINNSDKSYREKLDVKLPEIRTSVEKTRIKMSQIKENTFEKSNYTTGVEELDNYINLLPKNLCYVYARPSVGKSMFVLNLGLANSLRGVDVLYISLEMSPAQTKSRVLTWVNNGDVDSDDIAKIEDTEEFSIIDEKFTMIDSETSNGEVILSTINDFFKDYPRGIVILDSINLVKFSGITTEFGSLTKMSRALKDVCRKNDAIVVACAQAARSSETLGLSMDSLYGSSALEQDADILIGLEPTGKNKIGDSTPIKYKITKNRDGIKDIDIDGSINKATSHFYDSINQG